MWISAKFIQNFVTPWHQQGATSATMAAPKFSDTLTLFQPGGQIVPNIAEVAPKISLRLHLSNMYIYNK